MLHRSCAIAIAVTVFAFSMVPPLAAQDAHYWSHQYGTQGQLLGGLVVGTTADLSSTYYNPGATAVSITPKLILSTDAIEYITLELKNGAGRGIDLQSTRGGTAPSLFAARLSMDWLGDNAVSLSYLTRQDFDISLDARAIGERNVLDRHPGDESFASELTSAQKGRESWYGISWARSPRENVGFGVTQYFAYRYQESRVQAILQAITPDADGAAIIGIDDFKYSNLRLLWKAGGFVQVGKLGLGVSLTTPGVNLYGNGSSFSNLSFINLDTNGDSTLTSELVSNFQKDISAQYRSPISIAAGASYEFKSTALYGSIEWFDAVDAYDVMDPVDYPSQSTGELIPVALSQSLKSVINFGGGISHQFSEHFSLYGAFIVDRSAIVSREESELSVAAWDIYHTTVGSAFDIRDIDFTPGVSNGTGKKSFPVEIDISGSSEEDQLRQSARISDVRYSRWLLIIGLAFPL